MSTLGMELAPLQHEGIAQKFFCKADPLAVMVIADEFRVRGISPEEMEQLLRACQEIAVVVGRWAAEVKESLIAAFDVFANRFSKAIGPALEALSDLMQEIEKAAFTAPDIWWHYYTHSKKARIRKKYEHRIHNHIYQTIFKTQGKERLKWHSTTHARTAIRT